MILFSQRLKEILFKKNISIKDFAKKIAMSEIGLHNALKNNSTKIETIYRISKALDVNPSYFFKTDDEISNDSKIKDLTKVWQKVIDYEEAILNALYNGTETWRFFSTWSYASHTKINEKVLLEFDKKLMDMMKHREFIQKFIDRDCSDKKLYQEIMRFVNRDDYSSFENANSGEKIRMTKLIERQKRIVKP